MRLHPAASARLELPGTMTGASATYLSKVLGNVLRQCHLQTARAQRRTSSGRVAARARGVRFGRPPKLTPEQIALGRRLVDEGTSVRDVAKVILKCHPATLYRELDKFGPASTRANALAGE